VNIRDMHYLVAVADLRSFSQAANQCCISQPTLSGQIKKLEQDLGIKIFERNNKRVIPTDVGRTIIHCARNILHEVETIKETSNNAHEPLAGKFRLGAFPTLSTYIFPLLVPNIKQAMPKLRLILLEEKTAVLIDKLHKGEIDAALLALPINSEALTSQVLFNDEFYLATSSKHSLAGEKHIDQQILAQHRLLLLEEGHCLRDQALDVCQLYNINEEPDLRATGLETLRAMVQANTGITLMPNIAVKKPDKGISYVPFNHPAPYRTIGLVWRKTSTRKPVLSTLCTLMMKPQEAL